MSDTPDIPDPASPTPAVPAAAKPRRVITRPDTAYTPRQPGSRVVTRPDAAQASRLPGTYAADHGSDPNWRRGVAMLWVLFSLAAIAEFLRAVVIVWSGAQGLPFEYDAGRIGAEALVFLLLWVGWSWPRWLLVAVDFGFGVWFVMTSVVPLPGASPLAHPSALVTMPALALGIIYLVTAGYLAFSADVIGFVRHRREEGRGWVIAPIFLIVAAYAGAVLGVQPFSKQLFVQWQPQAEQFATESFQAMAQKWDVAEFERRADPEYLKVWTEDQRKQTFGFLSGLGQPQNAPTAKMVDQPKPAITRSGKGVYVTYDCEFGQVRFAHGSTKFGCMVSRGIFGPWQLENLVVSEPQFDPEPSTAPAVPPAALSVPPAAPAVP